MTLNLTSREDGKCTYTLVLTEAELMALDQREWSLEKDILRLWKTKPEEAADPVTEQIKPEPIPEFILQDYKQLKFETVSKSREYKLSSIYDLLTQCNNIPVDMEKLEEEVTYQLLSHYQRMKYQRMFAHIEVEDVDEEALREEIRGQLLRDQQIEQILNSVIKQECLEASREELEAAAQALAKKENSTMEMVYKFMGEDLGMLQRDVLRKKAEDLLLSYIQ